MEEAIEYIKYNNNPKPTFQLNYALCEAAYHVGLKMSKVHILDDL